MNTAEILMISGASVPDRTALVDPDERVSYADLQTRANKMANALQSIGVGKGQNVGIMAVNSAKFVELYYATAAVGATFVPLNFRAKPEELQYMCDASDVNVLFVSERYFPLFNEIKANLPKIHHVYTLDFAADGLQTFEQLRETGIDVPVFSDTDDDAAAIVIYTSGTTSMPKGVELSHKALTAYVVNTQSPADPSGVQDATLVAVPLFHIAGATTMLGSIWSGRKLTILPAFDPSGWLSMVEKEKVTHAMVVPTMLKRIMEVEDFTSTTSPRCSSSPTVRLRCRSRWCAARSTSSRVA